MVKSKLIRVTTVPFSLDKLLEGQLYYLNNFYEVIAVSGKGPSLDKVKEREKVRIEIVEMQRKISPFKDIVSLFQLIKLFKREKPNIVHSITPKAGLLSMVAAYIAGVSIRVHTFTGLIFPTKHGLFRYILILMDRILCRFATNIYPEGQGVKEDLIRFNITKKPLNVLANGNINGLDINYFDPAIFNEEEKINLRNQLDIPVNNFIFIFVGRLVKDKGINELVQAFSRLSELKNKISLLLVGPFEDDLDPVSKETLNEIQTNPNIYTVGYQDDVRPFFAISDALVFPSYREGFPNVVLQAGAMDLPAIVTNISGCNEIIQQGINGLIIPSKSIEELYEAMKQLLEDPVLHSNLKSTARQNIKQKYESRHVWQAVFNEYKRLES